jgi:hypothetical protein
MNRSPWIRALALSLALTTLSTGCVIVNGRPRGPHHCSVGVETGGKLETAARASSPLSLPEVGEDGGLEPTRHHHARAALLVGFGVVVGALVVVDLLTLPATVCYHREFYCTRTVYHHCCD